MKPGPRIQAAIEILDQIQAQAAAADRVLQAWGRAHRFAGSGDRRAIADHVYAVLRGGRGGEARAAMLSHLRSTGLSAEDAAALFDGSPHAPAPLTEAERAAWDTATTDTDPLSIPLHRAFGRDLDAELSALAARAPVDLRVNTLKANAATALESLAQEGILADPVALAPTALRVTHGAAQIEASYAYQSGLVEIQDAGSQAVAMLADAHPGHAVLDLCAGAGGKTLSLAAQMQNRGTILATDIAPVRLNRVAARLARAGVRIAMTQALAPDWVEAGAGPSGLFDRVVIDAPCSGSGTWRRNPETRARTTPQTLHQLARLQGAILDAAAPRVAPGGRLVYITCSLFAEEGEDVADAFAARHPGLTPIDAAPLYTAITGLAPPAGWGAYARLTPHRHGTDGFFAAIFKRMA